MEQIAKRKVAIVTGASSGIGAATARALAETGAKLVLVGRDAVRLARTSTEIHARGGDSLVVVADVTESGAPERVVARAVEHYGAIDIVVHNAGMFVVKSAVDTSTDDLDALLDLHVRAPFAVTRAALPHLGPGSSLIFVGSNLAHFAREGTAAYAASKAAEETLARNLAVELGPRGIRVNTVSPGAIKTPMTAHLQAPEVAAKVTAMIPMRRLGEPEDVASAVTYLCSDAARHIAGACLVIDGGVEAT